MRALRKSVKASIAEAGITELGPRDQLVGIGGTVRNLAKVDLRRTDYPLPLLHGYRLADKRLAAVIDELAGRTMKRRAQVPGLNPDRADTIVGGALVIQGIAKQLGASEIVVSSRGLREGLALATAGASAPSPEWVRSISVATLAARFRTWNAAAAERRTGLAADLIEALDPSAPPRLREMLDACRDLARHRAGDRLLRPVRARGQHRDRRRPRRVLPRRSRRAHRDPAPGRRRHATRTVRPARARRRPAGGVASRDGAHPRRRAEPPHPTGRTVADLLQLDARGLRGGRARAERMASARRRPAGSAPSSMPNCSWSRTNRRRCSPRRSSPTEA